MLWVIPATRPTRAPPTGPVGPAGGARVVAVPGAGQVLVVLDVPVPDAALVVPVRS